MNYASGFLLVAGIAVSAAGCTSMTDLRSERVMAIQSTKTAAYIPGAISRSSAASQSSVLTNSSPTHAELSSERILAIQSTRVAAYIPAATIQASVSTYSSPTHAISRHATSKHASPTHATSKHATSKHATSKHAASMHVASTRSPKAVRGKSKSGKSSIHKLVSKHARAAGVPVKLALAVVQVESNFNPRAHGNGGEVGLMQIKPATARAIGYKGSLKALYNPDTNLAWGMKYLAEAQRRGGGTVCGTILKYNAGHYAKRMTKTSLRYCGKVKLIMRKTA